MRQKKILVLLFLIAFGISLKAQLSDLHYLPPLKQGRNNAAVERQAVYLSTPEPTTFLVNVFRGTNPNPVASFNISNNSPAVYNLPNGDNNITLVNNANTGIVLTNSGLRFESPSGNRFYVNYRGNSAAQATSLTSKGRVAMGTRFKWGGVPNLGAEVSKSNTLGIMATEDNTTVTLSGYDPNCVFRLGNNVAGITDDTYTITLNANESFVFENYVGNSPTWASRQGWIGASIVSTRNIVISNGSMNFGRQENNGNRDAGIDQPVPENRLGKDYVFVRGNGHSNGWTEFPLIIATADNTQIFVNGSTTPIATLNNGDYFEVPSSFYSSSTAGANMFVQTSKDAYAYQCLAGSTGAQTAGLNFVAPVNCLLPDVMDNIPDIRNIAGTIMTGGVTIIAAVNTPDANIQVTDGTGLRALPPHVPVAGTSDWKTFYIPNLTGNVSVQSTGPMAVGFFGVNGNQGVAGYFSGFDTVPEVTLEIRGGTGCFVGSEIYEATGNFDAYQWYFEGEPIPGANGPDFAPTVAGDYFVRGTKGPCTYDSQSILALYCDPDIVVNKTVDNPEIMEGETATFTIRVRNFGVGPVTNLQITDNIPAGLTLESAFTISGSWSGNTWNIGTLNGGETAILELRVRGDEINTLPLLSRTNTATNSQDQTDSNTTPDSPFARIVIHNDFDNDGIRDILDLDKDNDGILDDDECDNVSFNISGGAAYNGILTSVDNYAVLDIFSLDNSFNLQFNGNDVAGEIQFQLGAPGNFARFLDGTTYGQSGNPNIWTVNGSPGSPTLRVVIDENGQFELFGARTSNGPLEPMVLTTPANPISWNGSGTNTLTVDQAVVGPTNMRGVLHASGCDTDNDGYPDQLDLDSDGDGCSDANEFYKDNNADGGDDGVFGAGTPSVNPDGTVIGASYVRVFAPEILLGNTTENLGGTDINGQDVSLGQSIQYVLRFQNTGDDNARNFTIRNVLPNNVTLDNVNVSNANGTTFNHDLATNTIDFSIPDNLVEVGDPEYSIRITVTIAGNCSEFVAACASQLENRAYVTYQGTLNTNTFSDEPGNGPISGCASTPEVASNSIFNDLSGCNEARTVQLCGDFVILSAGQGFLNYIWYLDANGNGIVDIGETALNDNDPDNDPRTFVVTTVGDYIVQKTTDGTCPDMMERITVERFGTTQTNPIVNFFNQVNSDNNPDNDLQGEIVTCSIDGDVLQKIFLCGANDQATIQLGITDAQSIVWQQLDESSCSSTGDDCANKNGTCTWITLATQNNFTVTDSGEYRVVINYQNGCFSRFYFNVFKNDLQLNHIASDMLCSTPGNIRITNVGSGYGFQLVDVDTDNIVIPFSANNGPNFDITSSGTYKVQVTQLNPLDGTPITGSCIFETADIGILERDLQVNSIATPADCANLGTIEVQALNVFPNYSYELRLDDGSNGGLGSLISSLSASNDNTHTFNGVAPGDYLVTTRTDDGCLDTQSITVDEIPELTLNASLRDNITCTSGVITLTAGGGIPNANYVMAIWSKDGVPLYGDPANIPLSAIQSSTSFLFGHRGSPSTYFPDEDGEYTFIVMDGSGCFAISNAVAIEDLGSLTVTASHSQITCADSATSTLTITVIGGTTPYEYSLDGGTTYQSSNSFLNLAAGFYEITVRDSSGNGSNTCTETLFYEIDQPFGLTASPSILEDASCDPNGALVKILNPNGGQAPYQFSFDGGSSFSGVDTQRLLPGTYQLAVNDALGCTYPMEITVPDPVADPTFAQTVDYDCLGAGTITITPSNTTDFTFEYERNGNPNAPLENNVFTNVATGTQTVTVTYATAITPNQSTLFLETFGAGPNTQISEIGPGYCYEPQNGSVTACNLGPAGILVDGEYSVTNFAANPNPAYRSPNDHTGLANGRFLAIHPSNNLVGSNSVIWSRSGIEVLPNRDLDISFWAYNLRQTGSAGNNPEIQVELLDAGGTVINSMVLPEIPKNTNADDWHNRTVTFNPGANSIVAIVLRSHQAGDDGNELILDDIQATQQPEICEKTTDITVVIEAGQAFEASLLSTIDPSCNGGSDGAIRFEVSNFDAATGFEYSTDGGATWTTSLVSPVTTTANLGSGAHTVTVRKVADTSCTTSINTNLNDPLPIVPQLAQVADYTCFNTGGTLEASATGGIAAYEYQLEDTSGNIIAGYQTNDRFANITDGDYVVRVRDQNGCDVVSTTPVTITPPSTITFDLLATACYDGQNNATVTANVTAGNGAYQFRINGGAWNAPTPSTATSYTFAGLSNGSYDIEVTDAFGCVSAVQPISISPTLLAQVDVVDVSACADGSITVTPSGGVAPYAYAFLPTGTTVQDSDFGTNNSFTITSGTIGTYDVYMRDNNAASPYCQLLETVTVQSAPILAYTATPTDALCFGDRGSIDVNISSGLAPFTYELVDVDHGTASTIQTGVMATTRTFFNLLPGDYNVIVTDDMGCSISVNAITIVEPAELTADIIGVLPSSCSSVDPLEYGFRFDNYPTTLGTIEFSADGGTTWTGDNSNPGVSDVLPGHLSGTNVFPSMRTVDGLGNTVCQIDLPRYTIPYPLDDLDITISTIVVNCNELQVSVQGSEGVPSYEYAYSDDPANFVVASATWIPGENFNMLGDPVTPGHGMYQWTGLVPGRTYVFYVRDSNGCVRQSNVNVNDITTNPMVITATYEPSCNGANDGEITYTIVDTDGFTEPNMTWTLFDINGNTIDSSGGPIPYNSSIAVTGLAPEEYYIVVQQVDGGGVAQCISASENLLLEELDPITATLNVMNNITCEGPGRISVTGIQGGGGNYTYTVTGPAPFTAITGSPNNPIEIPANSPSGNYDVEISDQYGCSYPLGTVTMTLTPNPSITNVDVANCSAATSVTITATTGASSMLYSLDGGATYVNNGGVFNNVVPGTYTVFVKDGNGCTDSTAITVHPSLQATASLTESLGCGPGQEAELTLSVSAGSGNYEYQVTNTMGTVVTRQGLATSPVTALALTADTYTVTVYDIGTGGPECSRVFTIVVPPAILPNFTADAVDVSCSGASDGSIALTQVNNGNNPLTYTLSPNNGTFNVATSTFEHLPADTYTVTATGPNGCTTVLNTVIVDEPNPITFTLPSVDAFGCTTGNVLDNAIISIDVASISGGSGTYTRYQFVDHATAAIWQNGTNPNLIFTDIAGGDVMVRVYDENGCMGEMLVSVAPYDALGTPTVHVDDAISCTNLGEDIALDITSAVTSFATDPGNYEFRQLPAGAFQASNQFTDLQPGNYTFVVRNRATGCERVVNHSVADPNTFGITVNKIADVVCFGDDGSITLTLTDVTYTGSFSWAVYNTNGTPADRSDDGTAVATGNLASIGTTPNIDLPAGNYIVEVFQDAFPDCGQVRSFNINTPPAPVTLDTIALEDVGCSNDQGSAAIRPLGGVAPYGIQLTNTTTGSVQNRNGVNAHLFTNLTAGVYTVEVTDALGCTQTFTHVFQLLLPDPISGAVTATDLVCEGDTNASLSLALDPRNVTSNYRYRLRTYNDMAGTTLLGNSASQTSGNFNNLGAGFYRITVEDDMGCTYESAMVEIVAPVEVSAQLLTEQALGCQVGATLVLRAQGGTAPYSWSSDGITFNAMNENNGPGTHVLQNMVAGTYQYFVQDSFNCVSSLSNEITINAIEALTLELNASGAFINCNGESTALINATADGGLGNYEYALFADAGLVTEIRPYQPTGLFDALPQGTYYVHVRSGDCTVLSQVVEITEPEVLTITPTITDVQCFGDENGSIVIEAQGGTGVYQYAISPNLNQFDDENTFDELAPGDYSVIVQDSNGCFEFIEFTINQPELLEMELTSTPEVCAGDQDGTVSVTISGGTAPYHTALDSNADDDFVQDRLLFDDLAGGTYIVFVRDANGCTINQTITVEGGANLNATAEVVYECTGDTPNNSLQLLLEDTTIAGDVLYALDSIDPNDFGLDANFTNMAPGSHYVAIAHANGCINTIDFEVEAFEPLQLTLQQNNLNEITAVATGGSEGYTFYFGDRDNGDDNTLLITRTDTYTVRVVDANGCEAMGTIFMEFIDIEIPNFFTPDGDGLNDTWKPRNIGQYPDIFIKIFDRYGREIYILTNDDEGWNGLYQQTDLPTGDYWYIIKLNGEEDQREFIGHFTLYR
jgi:large repetitive protein